MSRSRAARIIAGMPKDVINLPPATRDAELRAASFNEADNTIEVCWTTGATVRRMSWRDGAYDEELIVSPNAVRLERLNAGAPLLNTHSQWDLKDVIGAVVPGTARIEKGQGFARVALSKAPGDADIVQKIRDGIIRNISVGYIRHQIEKIEKDDETPIWRVVDWEPHEISAVPVPADAGSQFRAAAAGKEAPLFPCAISTPQGDEAMPDPTAAPTTSTQDTKAIRAERERVKEINTIARQADLGGEDLDNALEAGTSVEAFRKFALDTMAERSQVGIGTGVRASASEGSRIIVLRDGGETRRQGMTQAIVARMARASGQRDVQIPEVARRYGEMGLVEMAAECIGYRGNLRTTQQVQSVFDRAFLTTSDFPAIFTDAMNVRLLARYQAAPVTYRRFAARHIASDFRPMAVVRAGDFPALQPVGQSGEIKHGSFSESKEQLKVDAYAVQMAISRVMIVNDQLNAIDQVLGSAGDRVADWENVKAFAKLAEGSGAGPVLLTDNKRVFHTDHGNLAGTPSIIDIANIGLGRAAMMKQKTLDGILANFQPKILLTGADKLTQAEQLLTSITPATNATAVPESMRRLEPVGDGNLEGNAWYLFADPAVAPCFHYGYLEGYEGPRLTSEDQFGVQGFKVKLEHDFGIAATDFRGGYRNPGA